MTTPLKFVITIGDGKTSRFVVHHGLGMLNYTVQLFDTQTGESLQCPRMEYYLNDVVLDYTTKVVQLVKKRWLRKPKTKLVARPGWIPEASSVRVMVIG